MNMKNDSYKTVKTALGVETEVALIPERGKTSEHVTVKGRIYEMNETKHLPRYDVLPPEIIQMGDGNNFIYRAWIEIHGDNGTSRKLCGDASFVAGSQITTKTKTNRDGGTYEQTRDENADWIEKAQTKAIGRALAFAGFGNIFGSSIASAEDIVEYQRKQEELNENQQAMEQAKQQAREQKQKAQQEQEARSNALESIKKLLERARSDKKGLQEILKAHGMSSEKEIPNQSMDKLRELYTQLKDLAKAIAESAQKETLGKCKTSALELAGKAASEKDHAKVGESIMGIVTSLKTVKVKPMHDAINAALFSAYGEESTKDNRLIIKGDAQAHGAFMVDLTEILQEYA